MLIDKEIVCPHCQQITKVALASPDAAGRYTAKGSISSCRNCRERIITMTLEDGSCVIVDPGELPVPSSESVAKEEAMKSEGNTRPSEREALPAPTQFVSSRGVTDSQQDMDAKAVGAAQRTGSSPTDEPMVVGLNRVLWREDGTRRPRREALRMFGDRSLWVAELKEAIERRLNGPPPLSIPPRIFLSYRWSSPEADAWAENLALKLRSRGYFVIFDKTDCLIDGIPDFVSRLAECHIFLALLDLGYARRIHATDESGPMEDGWVFDEFNNAAALGNAGFLQVVGVLRGGDELPRGFRFPVLGRFGNAVDARDPERLESALDDLFPPITLKVSQADVDRVIALIRDSHTAAEKNDLQEAASLAHEAINVIPDIVDGYAQLARISVKGGDSEEGLWAAEAALAIAPRSSEMLSLAALLAYHLKQKECIDYCLRLFDLEGDRFAAKYLGTAHYILGNALDDLGQAYAGVAHLEIARRLSPDVPTIHNDTGFVYRRIGDLPRALACFQTGLSLSPGDAGLLVNQAGTYLEAANAVGAKRTLSQLRAHHPAHPALEGLEKLAVSLEHGGETVILLPRLPPRPGGRIIACSECAVGIPLANDKEVLCARCGAEHSEPGLHCGCCGGDGFVIPALSNIGASFLCPYCRVGHLCLR
jgi:tetratricopeptide (TPR) repeat protein